MTICFRLSEINITKESSRLDTCEDLISLGSLFHIRSSSLFDEVDSIDCITFHEDVLSFRHFNWFQ